MSAGATSPWSATWHNLSDEVVDETPGSHWCLAPNNPHDFAAASDDGEYEVIFRCRDCAGCRNYDNWLLRRRLANHYKQRKECVWIVTFESDSLSPSKLSAAVAVASRHEYEQGFLMLASNRIAKLKRGSRPSRSISRRGSIRMLQVKPVSRTSSVRAWSDATSGMYIPRSKIGMWKKRFYLTALAPLKEQTFIKQLRGGIRKRHPEAKVDALAWRRGFTLYPSLVQRGRLVLASLLAKTSARGARFTTNRRTPEAVVRVIQPVSENSAKLTGRLTKTHDTLYRESVAGSPSLTKALSDALASLEAAIKRNNQPNDTS
jgi:hypothetical protein